MTKCKICNKTEEQAKFHPDKKTYCIDCNKLLRKLNYYLGVVREIKWQLSYRKGDVK